jgi:hypothetical protein
MNGLDKESLDAVVRDWFANRERVEELGVADRHVAEDPLVAIGSILTIRPRRMVEPQSSDASTDSRTNRIGRPGTQHHPVATAVTNRRRIKLIRHVGVQALVHSQCENRVVVRDQPVTFSPARFGQHRHHDHLVGQRRAGRYGCGSKCPHCLIRRQANVDPARLAGHVLPRCRKLTNKVGRQHRVVGIHLLIDCQRQHVFVDDRAIIGMATDSGAVRCVAAGLVEAVEQQPIIGEILRGCHSVCGEVTRILGHALHIFPGYSSVDFAIFGAIENVKHALHPQLLQWHHLCDSCVQRRLGDQRPLSTDRRQSVELH